MSDIIRGIAIPFNVLSENLGGFRERIRPQAVRRTIKEKIDVRALANHDTGRPLGRVSRGTLRMSERPQGLYVEIEVGPQSYARDAFLAWERGDAPGFSWAFGAVADEWSLLPDGLPLRDVLDMRFPESSAAVTFPAYTATEHLRAVNAVWPQRDTTERAELRRIAVMARETLRVASPGSVLRVTWEPTVHVELRRGGRSLADLERQLYADRGPRRLNDLRLELARDAL